jgi:hypothetical protein
LLSTWVSLAARLENMRLLGLRLKRQNAGTWDQDVPFWFSRNLGGVHAAVRCEPEMGLQVMFETIEANKTPHARQSVLVKQAAGVPRTIRCDVKAAALVIWDLLGKVALK